LLSAEFPQYNFILTAWIHATAERDIKTLIAAGNPPDIARFWPQQMPTFVDVGMATDITPFLDADGGAWRNRFVDGALSIGEHGGSYWNTPYSMVYPMMIANQTLLAEAGVEIPNPESWTWDEFIDVMRQLQENLPDGVWPYAHQDANATWFVRNALLMGWDSIEQSESFAAGEISFHDPVVLNAMEISAYVFENFAFPGAGSLALSLDEVMAAFNQGSAAIIGAVNTHTARILTETEMVDDALILAWPLTGPTPRLLGGSNGLFIPANVRSTEISAKIMEFMTSPAAVQLLVDAGHPVPILGVYSDDPNFHLYSRDMYRLTPVEVINVSPIISETIMRLPADFIFQGPVIIDELEAERLAAID